MAITQGGGRQNPSLLDALPRNRSVDGVRKCVVSISPSTHLVRYCDSCDQCLPNVSGPTALGSLVGINCIALYDPFPRCFELTGYEWETESAF